MNGRTARRRAARWLGTVLVVATGTSASAGGSVSVLYAGSLAAVVEDHLGPAFTEATGIDVEGEAHGSLGAAQLIRDGLRFPDVFVSADPVVTEQVLMGPANGELVRWYVTFASSELVVGYSPDSPHVDAFVAAAAGERAWYDVLGEPGVSFGRGDPTIDPKGYRTLFMFDLAASYYDDASVAQLPGDPLNPEQVLPEVSLLARVDSGQFDAGIFYRHEAVAAGLPYLTLPPEINLGSPEYGEHYAEASYELPDGTTIVGAPILFTVTIPATVRDRAAAEAFVVYLLNARGQIEELGFGAIDPVVAGDSSALPPSIAELVALR
jgi:molybdate/tungstate transport system substrate-binding protein